MEQMPKGVEGGQKSEATLLLQRDGGKKGSRPAHPAIVTFTLRVTSDMLGRYPPKSGASDPGQLPQGTASRLTGPRSL